MNIAFIVASPRSGTTFLEEIFNTHPNVCGWHEPYFIWEYYLKSKNDDYLGSSSVSDKTRLFIRKEFEYYLRHSNKTFLLEKTPNNAFKIDYIHNLFPEAKWIHLYRDGRDVVSSMKKRYEFRKTLVLKKNLLNFISDIYFTLKMQPFWRHRFLAVWYELKKADHIRPYLQITSSKWKKSVGWGPRYPGWKIDKDNLSEIEFMANQWVKSEEYIKNSLNKINENNIYHLKYEDLLKNPKNEFKNLTHFLNIDSNETHTMASRVLQNNSGNWEKSLTEKEIQFINPIIQEMLKKYNYI